MRVICLLFLLFSAPAVFAQPSCPKYEEAMQAGKDYLSKSEPDWEKALIEFQAAQIAARECGLSEDLAKAPAARLQEVFEGLQAQRDRAVADRERAERAEAQARRALTRADQKTREAEWERDRADSLRRAAERTGEANRLAASALEIQTYDPTLAARLADHAYRFSGRRNPLAAKIRRNIYRQTDRALYTTEFVGHSSQVQAYAFSPDGKYLLTADRVSIILWHLNGRQLQHLSHPQETITALKFSPDGRYFLSGSTDHTAVLWSINGELLQVLRGHEGRILDVAFTSDGRQMLTAATDGTIRRWNRQGQQEQQHQVQWGALPKVVFSPDGRQVIAKPGDQSGEVKLFTLDNDSIEVSRLTPLNYPGPITAVGFYDRRDIDATVEDGSSLSIPWYSGPRGGVTAYDIADPSAKVENILDVAFVPPAGRITSLGPDGMIYIHDFAGNLLFKELGSLSNPSARFSPDGQYLLTLYQGGNPQLWEVPPPPPIAYGSHQGPIRSIDVSTDGRHILLGSSDGTATLWDAQGNYLRTLSGHDSGILTVDFSPNGQAILTGSRDQTARLWDLDGRMLLTYRGPKSEIRAVSFYDKRPTHQIGVIAYASGAIAPDLTSDDYDDTWQGKIEIWDYAASPTDNSALVGTSEGIALVWDGYYQVLDTLDHGDSFVFAVAYSPDGKYMLTGSSDHLARLWNRQGELLQEFKGHTSTIFDVAFSPDGQYVLTAGQDHTARLWNLYGNQVQQFTGHQDIVRTVTFLPDGRHILTGSDDHTARIWTIDGQLLHHLGGHQGRVTDIAVSPDGQYVLSSSEDRTAVIWDRQGNMLQQLTGHERKVYAVAISPDGRTRLTGDQAGKIRLWDTNGELLRAWQAHEGALLDAVFSPDGKYVLSGGADDKVMLWNLSGRPVQSFLGHSSNIQAVAFSPDGQYVLSGSDDETARLWSRDGRSLLTLKDFILDVTFVAFTPDGQQLLTGAVTGELSIWSLEGRLVRQFHLESIIKAALSPDGSSLLIATEERTAVLKDLFGNEIQDFFDPHQGTLAVAFAPDGRHVFTAGRDHGIQEWITIDHYFTENQELDFRQAQMNDIAFDYRKLTRPGNVLDHGINRYRSFSSRDPEETFVFLDSAQQIFTYLVDRWGAPYHYYLSNVQYAKGLHYLRQGEFAQSIDHFQQALTTDTSQIWLQVPIATAWVFGGQVGRARAIYTQYQQQEWNPAWPIDANDWKQAFLKHLEGWSEITQGDADADAIIQARDFLQGER